MGIWDSEVHLLWLWELQQLGLEHAAETEGQEEGQLAISVDQVSESHLCQQRHNTENQNMDGPGIAYSAVESLVSSKKL